MVYDLHKQNGYIATIHTSNDNTLEVIFPDYILDSRHAPKCIRYESRDDKIIYTEDNRTLEYAGFPAGIFRLTVLVDLSCKFTDRDMSRTLCECIDKDGDLIRANELEECIMSTLPVVDSDMETSVYLGLFAGVDTDYEDEVSYLATLVECGGFGKYEQA